VGIVPTAPHLCDPSGQLAHDPRRYDRDSSKAES